MADVNISIYTNKIYKQGASTVVPGFIEGEEPTPINPSGSGGASEFVPYVGATENFDLGEFGMSAGFLKLDTTPTNTPTDQGTMYWDEDDNTVDIILNGYIMKVGEDLFYPVKNQTGSSIPKGTNVGFAGTLGSSGRLLITPYLANGANPTSRYMGVTAETIANGDDGKVLWFGRIRGINTNAFNEGDILYASTSSAGAFQTTLPVAPNNIVEVAAVINKSSTQGVIFVRPQFLSSASIGGSVALNQVAYGSGTNQIQGSASFVYDGNLLSVINQTTLASRGISIQQYSSDVAGCQMNFFKSRVGGAFTDDRASFGCAMTSTTGQSIFFITGTTNSNRVPNLFIDESGGVGVGLGGNILTTVNRPTGRLDVRGFGTTTGITLLLENSTGANNFEFLDNGNISIPSTNGAKIGTATTQKIGFWNATPIVQPTTAIAESAFVENSGGTAVNDDSTFDGYTLRQVVKALRDAGLLA
jgi:hypothetical protein